MSKLNLKPIDQLRVLNYLQLQRLGAHNRLSEKIDTHREHAMIDSVCSDDIVERVRAELALKGVDVGFDLSSS
jgi:hypothetical protein